MAASEIDEIFALRGKSKGKAKADPPSEPIQNTLPLTGEKNKRKKKKDKKRKLDEVDESGVRDHDDGALAKAEASSKTTSDRPDQPNTKRRKIVEVVHAKDPGLTSSPPRPPPAGASGKEKAKGTKKGVDVVEEEARFKDSRGTGPRKKTEEGWSVYKEDELGINADAGDTSLCPFDCDCCF